jgi:hypothetical protein
MVRVYILASLHENSAFRISVLQVFVLLFQISSHRAVAQLELLGMICLQMKESPHVCFALNLFGTTIVPSAVFARLVNATYPFSYL